MLDLANRPFFLTWTPIRNATAMLPFDYRMPKADRPARRPPAVRWATICASSTAGRRAAAAECHRACASEWPIIMR